MALFWRYRKAPSGPGAGETPPPLNAPPPGAPPPLPGPFHILSQFVHRAPFGYGQSQPSPFAHVPAHEPNLPAAYVRNYVPKAHHGFIRRAFHRLPFKYRVALTLPAVGLGLATLGFGGLMIYYTVTFPHPLAMRNKERAPVIRILARDGAVLAERGAAAEYMPLDLLPGHVTAAVVATEDRRFFEHHGLDPIGLVRAVFANLRAGRFAQGGSTLTQQLAKNLFLTPDRTLARKVEELALALWLELRLSKHDILELYLNRVYFGGGAYGIEAASKRYFDRSARELTLGQAALIAGLLKAPSKYSPASSPGAARARSHVVLAKMVESGAISKADELKALTERIMFVEPKSSKDSNGVEYAIDFVLERLPPLVGGGHSEIVVETTLDADLQRKANEIVARGLTRQGESLGASQAAVVVLDNEGGIRALIGGRNYADSQFNRAVKARRQPGSAFKPFVYLAALEAGLTPDSITYDLPLTIDGWAPRNDNGQFVGEISMRRALAQSVNTVAVRLNQQVGRGRAIAVARRLGIKSDLREGPSLALGTSEVSLLELTGAYGVFGNGGIGIEPHAIRRVRMSSGRVLFARDMPKSDQIVDPVQIGAMNDMLNAALVTGTGKRAAIADHPAAGKTGTTQDFRDAWFIGYTGHLTAGVWIGNDNTKPMNHAFGGGLPADIWRELMTTAHDGKAPLALPGTTRQMSSPASAPVASSPVRAVQTPDMAANTAGDMLPWLKSFSSPAPVLQAMPVPLPTPAAEKAKEPHATLVLPRAASRRQATVSVGRVVVKPPAPLYPSEAISDDFIAKAMDESTPAVATEQVADSAPAATGQAAESGPEPAAPIAEQQPKPSRPRGMMSLGGWW